MEQYIYKKLNMIGFDIDEFKKLFKDKLILELSNYLKNNKISLVDLQNDKSQREKVAKIVFSKNFKNKEYVEFFIALDLAIMFYPNSKIFFILKDSIPPKTNIKNLDDLKKIIKENSLVDFAIIDSDYNMRQFQLKQYQDQLETEKLLDYILKKLYNYGNNIGNDNLIIILQGKSNKISQNDNMNMNIDFEEINIKLKDKNFNFKGQILIAYNDQDGKSVINQVFPDLTTSDKKHDANTLNGWFV